jgi:hypothetical protein
MNDGVKTLETFGYEITNILMQLHDSVASRLKMVFREKESIHAGDFMSCCP